MFILKAFVGVKNVPNDGDEELYNLLRNELDYYAKHYSLHSVWKSLQKMFYLNFPPKMCLLNYLCPKRIVLAPNMSLLENEPLRFAGIMRLNAWFSTTVHSNITGDEICMRNMSLIYHAQLRFCLGIICAAQLNLFFSRFARKSPNGFVNFKILFCSKSVVDCDI